MIKIAFLLLAHKDPEWVIAQARALCAHGDYVAIHIDSHTSRAAFEMIQSALADEPHIVFARRVHCGWGEYSLVQASLNAIKAARKAFEGITYYILISGHCFPTKTRGYIERYLQRKPNCDFIENHDFFESGWIRTGIKEERLIYRHWFNERSQKWLFYQSLSLQARLGLARPVPAGLKIRIGSQWWALRAQTVERLMHFIAQRRDIVRFFRTTWIPDEIFFQTLVSHLVPANEIRNHSLTHLHFSDYGMPVVFYNDHEAYLRAEDRPFARKIASSATQLRNKLLGTFKHWDCAETEGGGEQRLYPYLSARGREGTRYATPFWLRAIERREDESLLVLLAKDWYLGKQIADIITRNTTLISLGYLFDEPGSLPVEVGNFEHGMSKRGRHRRAFLNVVFTALQAREIMICLDPGRLDILDDLVGNVGSARILSVERLISDNQLLAHAYRVGVLSVNSGSFEKDESIRAIRHEFKNEIKILHRDYRGMVYRNDPQLPHRQNVLNMGHFLQLPRTPAEAIIREITKIS